MVPKIVICIVKINQCPSNVFYLENFYISTSIAILISLDEAPICIE